MYLMLGKSKHVVILLAYALYLTSAVDRRISLSLDWENKRKSFGFLFISDRREYFCVHVTYTKMDSI